MKQLIQKHYNGSKLIPIKEMIPEMKTKGITKKEFTEFIARNGLKLVTSRNPEKQVTFGKRQRYAYIQL